MMTTGPGIDKDMIMGFVGVGLDDEILSENVVETGEGLLVGRLWIGVEFRVHGKFR
jgi:Ca2+-binding RTX toxin-like protein